MAVTVGSRQAGTSARGIATTPRVSILIPTYRDAHLLRKSLPVLLSNEPDEIEIVVLNNDAEQDVAAAIGESADDRRVRIVEMGYPAGPVGAFNRGMRDAGGELVFYCNADLFPTESFLPEMIRFFEEHPRAGAAMGKLLRYDLEADRPTDVIDSGEIVLTRQRRMMQRVEGEPDVGQCDDVREVFALDGAAVVVRRAALEDIRFGDEYLDRNFVTHKDDHDLSWRLRLAGWECWLNGKAVAYHGRTTRGLGSAGYLSSIRSFHENERAKSLSVRTHAMKNQWLMLLKNEDGHNFVRDFPFILGREAMVVGYNLVFAPRALVAVPQVLRVLPETLRKRRAAKRRQKMDPHELRRWLRTGP